MPPATLSETGKILSVGTNFFAASYAQVEAEGLSMSLSFLLCGPPGTGKSRLARHIARELGVELFLARLDGLISSYVGSTSKNIRALFEFASKRPCVLFLDEFDAIAKIRGDGQELGELKRVVNSFIQNLDTLGTQSIVIAATNHQELLDAAVWRRFSYRLELGYPTSDLRRQLWQRFTAKLGFTERDIDLLVDLSDGFSGSDIHETSLRLHRRQLLGKTPASLPDALGVMQNLSIGEGEERRFLNLIRGQDEHAIAAQLRQRNSKLYSHAAIAQLLGVSNDIAWDDAHRRGTPSEQTLIHKARFDDSTAVVEHFQQRLDDALQASNKMQADALLV